MSRAVGLTLLVSLMLNMAFISGTVVHWWDNHGAFGHRSRVSRLAPPVAEFLHQDRVSGEWQRDLERWPERRVSRLQTEIKLREEQRRQLAVTLGELRNEMSRIAVELRRSRQELDAVLAYDPDNRTLIQERVHAHNELQGRLNNLVAEAMAREASILSPEQRRKRGHKERLR